MDYSRLVELYQQLEKEPGRLKKIELLAALLASTPEQLLPDVTLLAQGSVFPAWDQREIGIADRSVRKIVAQVSGASVENVSTQFSKLGDYGTVLESLARSQRTLAAKKLTVEKVVENLRAAAAVSGSGAQERKAKLVAELLAAAKPAEAKYVIRTVLGQLRAGVAEGVVRDAVVAAFLPKEDKAEATGAVEWAWYLRTDYGEVAAIAKRAGIAGLKRARLELGRPYQVLLSEKAPSLEEALAAFERPVLEWKYDGMRCIMQKQGSRVWLFTRRLEDVTAQFPDIVASVRRAVKPEEAIIEGEVLALDAKGKPRPFQELSQRIKRKHGIAEMAAEVPVQVYVFDAVLLDDEPLFERTLEQRRQLLEKAIKPVPGKFQLSEQLATPTLAQAERFYQAALAANQEGLMVKNLDSRYYPGRRVGYWLKVKPVMESLDLAIIGGTWGTGKRTGWFGSFLLGCRTPEGFAACGMIGTGMKEKAGKEGDVTFAELTKLLKPHITEEQGNSVTVKPTVIVEVAYEEIQKSPKYASGFALRFPRVAKIRWDRGPADADDLARIKRLYASQKGKR